MLRIALAITLVLAAIPALAQSEAQKSFDKLKTLVGTWEGKTSQGQTTQVTFRLTAGGSALLSEIDHENMITMFHLDGDRLLMTHYCAAGNQPRMVGTLSPDGKTLRFDFLDATNLASSQAGHMTRVVFTLPDATHQVEEWTFLTDGKERTEVFNLQRKN
ncbi:MAG TPA: hypothetical protein VEI01_18220 [Terriglobales bacterium]|nr:hypothetical protein [Terriglobales bacterium]